MSTLLLEIISEPMPPSLQQWAWHNLEQSLRKELRDTWGYEIPPVQESEHFLVTPYRLVLHIASMAASVPQRTIAERGPREYAPQKALSGFLHKHGISKEQCVIEENKKGRFWFYHKQTGGENMEDVLGSAIVAAIVKMKWPKIMRFANEEALWIRPLQRLVATFDGNVLKGGLDCRSKSWQANGNGESYLGYQSTTWDDMLCLSKNDQPREITVKNIADYKKMGILLKTEDRILHLAGLARHKNEQWLQSVAYLLERGFLLTCELRNNFENLPNEVIKTALLDHMKVWVWHIDERCIKFYAAIEERADGRQDRALIGEGYKQVAVARLRDADFFWREDAKITLEARLTIIDKQVWHKNLASVGDKARRISNLSASIATILNEATAEDDTIALAKRAGLLSKSDLSTDLVGEYAALQGVIGGFYALRDGEHTRVAQAIQGQYSEDRLIADDVVSLAVFLADRMDTLVGMWKSNNIPTSSRDPFALRRATKEVASVLYKTKAPVSFTKLITLALEAWKEKDSPWRTDLCSYYRNRLIETIAKSALDKAVVTSVLANCQAANLSGRTIREQFEALHKLDKNGTLAALTEMFRRASGLIGDEAKHQEYDQNICNNAQEKALADALKGLGKNESNVVGYAKCLLGVKPAFDDFCDNVRILDATDHQQASNRKKLLQTLIDKLQIIGAFAPLVRFYSQREEQQ